MGCHGPRFTYLIRDGEGGQRVSGPSDMLVRSTHSVSRVWQGGNFIGVSMDPSLFLGMQKP